MDTLIDALQAAAQQLPPFDLLLGRLREVLVVGMLAALGYALVAKLSYGHKRFDQGSSPLQELDRHVLQVDDLGQFWDQEPATQALKDIAESARTTNTIVVVFIHGWHHNAKYNDREVVRFAESLKEVKETLGNTAYRRSREQLTEIPGFAVKGVYIGWRGRSLPGWLDLLTFWTRKAAAERVGQGDVRDFLLRLQNIYEEANNPASDQKRPFMGLVSIGHSFGGQVLFRAVEAALESELVKITRPHEPNVPSSPGPLSGFGDLVVLLNPAFEALQYQTIHELTQRLQFAPTQPPILLVLSAPNDWARVICFLLGRLLYTLFSPWLSLKRLRLSTQALGVYAPQRTHQINVLAPKMKSAPFDPTWYATRPEAILNYDLSNIPTIARLELKPRDAHRRYSPFVVAHIDGTVLVRHSGIYKKELRDFLVDYIAIAQGKRILSRHRAL